MLCENCNLEMIPFVEGRSCGLKCPKCGQTLVTTYTEEYEQDETIYTVSVEGNQTLSADDLHMLSKLGSLPILEAKKLATTGGSLFQGKASHINDAVQAIHSSSIKHSICPSYPYLDT